MRRVLYISLWYHQEARKPMVWVHITLPFSAIWKQIQSFLAISEPSLYFLLFLIHVLTPISFGLPLILLLNIDILLLPPLIHLFCLHIHSFRTIPLSLIRNFITFIPLFPFFRIYFSCHTLFPSRPVHYSLRWTYWLVTYNDLDLFPCHLIILLISSYCLNLSSTVFSCNLFSGICI